MNWEEAEEGGGVDGEGVNLGGGVFAEGEGSEKECRGAKAGVGSRRTLEREPREDSAVKLCESEGYMTDERDGGGGARFKLIECRWEV